MKIKIKIWIEKNKDYFLGEGLVKLLAEIKKNNSLKIAAKKLKMSYRQAWGDIKEAEYNFNIKLIETKVGGLKGGETKTTKFADELVKKFFLLEKNLQKIAQKKFAKIFKN